MARYGQERLPFSSGFAAWAPRRRGVCDFSLDYFANGDAVPPTRIRLMSLTDGSRHTRIWEPFGPYHIQREFYNGNIKDFSTQTQVTITPDGMAAQSPSQGVSTMRDFSSKS